MVPPVGFVALDPISSIEWSMIQATITHWTPSLSPLYCSIKSFVPLFLIFVLHHNLVISLLPGLPLLPVSGEPWLSPCASCCCILRWGSSRFRPQPPIALTNARRIVLRDANPWTLIPATATPCSPSMAVALPSASETATAAPIPIVQYAPWDHVPVAGAATPVLVVVANPARSLRSM